MGKVSYLDIQKTFSNTTVLLDIAALIVDAILSFLSNLSHKLNVLL